MLLDREALIEISDSLYQSLLEGDIQKSIELSRRLSSTRIANVLTQLEVSVSVSLLIRLDKRRAGRVLANMPEEVAISVLMAIDGTEKAKLLNSIPADNLSSLLDAADEETRTTFLELLRPHLRQHVEKINQYPANSAGRIMIPYYLTAKSSKTVAETMESVMSAPPEVERTPYIYVLDEKDQLAGVISIKDMLRERPESLLKDVMNTEAVAIECTDRAYEAAEIIRNRRLMMLPVIDSAGHIEGVITFDDAMKVLTKDAANLLVSASAVPKDETFFTHPVRAVKGRLPWMAANVFLNLGAVVVITSFEATIATVAILAAFIPMITDMGGNVGIQSLSVAIRSIALGGVKIRDIKKVIKKEILVGLINGLALGFLFAIIAFVLRGNPYLGILAGTALGINVLVAGVIGGTLPFLIKAIGKDPAMMTGPVLTTITDITGVSIYLGLSSIFIALLT